MSLSTECDAALLFFRYPSIYIYCLQLLFLPCKSEYISIWSGEEALEKSVSRLHCPLAFKVR